MALHPNLSDVADCIAFCDFPVVEGPEFQVSVVTFEDGTSQAFKVSDVKLRRFTLTYRNQSDAEKASFVAFYDARFGPFSKFYWTNIVPPEIDLVVRFADEKIKYSRASVRTWNWTCTLDLAP